MLSVIILNVMAPMEMQKSCFKAAVDHHFVECRYAEYHYSACCYAKRRGTDGAVEKLLQSSS